MLYITCHMSVTEYLYWHIELFLPSMLLPDQQFWHCWSYCWTKKILELISLFVEVINMKYLSLNCLWRQAISSWSRKMWLQNARDKGETIQIYEGYSVTGTSCLWAWLGSQAPLWWWCKWCPVPSGVGVDSKPPSPVISSPVK